MEEPIHFRCKTSYIPNGHYVIYSLPVITASFIKLMASGSKEHSYLFYLNSAGTEINSVMS